VTMAMTGAHRTGVRTIVAVRMVGIHDAIAIQRLATLCSLANDLAEADRKLVSGESTAIDHESLVWQVYDQLTPVAAAPR
jgi:hypothetical protein